MRLISDNRKPRGRSSSQEIKATVEPTGRFGIGWELDFNESTRKVSGAAAVEVCLGYVAGSSKYISLKMSEDDAKALRASLNIALDSVHEERLKRRSNP